MSIVVTAADTWEYIEVNVPATSTAVGTWDVGTGVGVSCNFVLHAGSTWAGGTANVWQTYSNTQTTSSYNLLDNTANNFYVTDVRFQ